MDLVRRIYLYAMSAVALGVLAFGLQALLTVLLHAIGLRGSLISGEFDGDRQALSLAISLVGVGLPVWAVHWFLVERGLRGTGPGSESERSSALRALYLSGVLAVLLLIGALAVADVIRFLLERLLPNIDVYYADPASSLASLIVMAAGWVLHAWTRRRDLARGELRGAAVWWPRAYRYGVTFVGLAFFVEGIGALLALGVDALTGSGQDPSFPEAYTFRLAQALPNVLIGLVAWASHAWASDRLASGSGWHAASERASRFRLAYWPLVVGVAAIAALGHAAEALRPFIALLIGADPTDFADRGLTVVIAGAAGAALPWLGAWWLHRRWAQVAASASGETGRAALADRLERHFVAGVGLAFGAVGVGWVAGLAIDVLFGGNRAFGHAWRFELGQFLAFAVMGLPLWTWNWTRLTARRTADPTGEAGSAVRRTYLLLAVGAAILSTLGSLAIVLYRLVSTLLGAGLGGNAVSELSTPLGALAVAAAVVVYHGLALRSDQAIRAPEAASAAPAIGAVPVAAVPDGPSTAAAPGELAVRRTLVLTAPADADIGETMTALRGALPEGQSLDEA